MRTILRYVDGKAQWSENIPAATGSSPLGGSLVVGGPGAYELNLATSKAKHQRERERERAARAAGGS